MTDKMYTALEEKLSKAETIITSAIVKRDHWREQIAKADSLKHSIQERENRIKYLQEPGDCWLTINKNGRGFIIKITTPEMLEHLIAILELDKAKFEAEYDAL